MKIFLFALATGLIITNSCFANCYNISDSDLKYACLAETKNDEGYCYRISNPDDKNFCLAKLKRQKASVIEFPMSIKRTNASQWLNNGEKR